MSPLPGGTIAVAAILAVTLPRIYRAMVARRDRALAAQARVESLEGQLEEMSARVMALEERLDFTEQLSARLARQLEAPRADLPPK